MRDRLKMMLVGAALAALATVAWGQVSSLFPTSFTGNETWQVAVQGPGGTSEFVTTAMLRNTTGVTTTAQTSGTLVLTSATSNLISTAASVSLTVDLPPKPFDGQIFEWLNGSGGAFTAGTIAVTDGSTIVNGSTTGTLAAGASKEWRYSLATTSWYAMR